METEYLSETLLYSHITACVFVSNNPLGVFENDLMIRSPSEGKAGQSLAPSDLVEFTRDTLVSVPVSAFRYDAQLLRKEAIISRKTFTRTQNGVSADCIITL